MIDKWKLFLILNISLTSYASALKLSFTWFLIEIFSYPVIIVSSRIERADTKGPSLKVETLVAPLKRYLTYLLIPREKKKRTLNFCLLKLIGPWFLL